jgi:DNA-binding NarL/FixJ family response regulator
MRAQWSLFFRRGTDFSTQSDLSVSAYDADEGDPRVKVTDHRTAGSIRAAGHGHAHLLVRPLALVGSRWAALVVASCVAMLAAVFLAEILTPDVVISSLALGPLLAGQWVLSARWAALVAGVAGVLFGLAVITESSDRRTVIVIGITMLTAAIVTRMYANGLAAVMARHRHQRPAVATSVMPATLEGFDGFTHGIKALTRRELEVARLAAHGYTAAQIGLRLHISGRTVESHLASTYQRLRISSRLELARVAPTLGPVD